MKVWMILVALVLPATAFGKSLTLDRAQHVAGHVRHLEARNHYKMRARIGGPFALSHPSCDPRKIGRLFVCTYIATALHEDPNGMRMRCSVDVTIRGVRAHWSRSVTACAAQLWPNPLD